MVVTRKWILQIAASAAALFWLSAGWSAQFELRVGHNAEMDHPYQKGFETFKEILEKRSGGRIVVTIYPSGELGAEDKVNMMVREGLIAAQATSVAGGLAPFVPDADALDYPFLFRDLDHYYRVMDGAVGKQIASEVEDRLHVVFLGWGFSGVRNLWNKKRPVTLPEDLRGLKIRVISSKAVIGAFTSLGADVTPMSFGELYNALEQGVIDGAETDDIDLMVEDFYDVTRYVSNTEHLYLGAGYIFSRKIFDKLPPDLQQLVLEAGRAAVIEERLAMARKGVEARAFLQSRGIKYNDVNRARFEAGVAGLYSGIAPPSVAALVQQIRAQ
jgi:TRAP-type transport system periplasmic protein